LKTREAVNLPAKVAVSLIYKQRLHAFNYLLTEAAIYNNVDPLIKVPESENPFSSLAVTE
jgi:hypothetical protein